MRRISVGDVMTRKVVSAQSDTSLHECARLMEREGINSLPVTGGGKKLVGIITAGDILRAITRRRGADLRKVRAIDIASKKIAIIKPSADISQALEKMKYHNFRRLPVLSNGELIGMITLKDILSVEPSLYSNVNHMLDEIKELDRKIIEAGKEWPLQGLCDSCGAFAELLKVEGRLLCYDCRDEMN